MRHDCGTIAGHTKGTDRWMHCVVCEGRLHQEGCTSRKNKQKDCCPARHKMLHDQGLVMGIVDSSFFMWTPEYPQGVHPNDLKREK